MQLLRLAEPVSIFPDRDAPSAPGVARPGSITRGAGGALLPFARRLLRRAGGRPDTVVTGVRRRPAPRAAGSSRRRPGMPAIEGRQDALAAIPLVAGQSQGLYEALALPGDFGFGEAGHRPLHDLGRELRLRPMGQPQSQRAGILARIALREAAALALGQGVGGKREWGDPVHVISMASGTARLSAS